MSRKIISVIMVLACLFMLVAGVLGIRDVLQEKSDGEKEKAETLESLDTLKAGVEKLEANRQAYEDGKLAYDEGTAAYEQGKSDYAKGQNDLAAGINEYNDGKNTLAAGKAEYAAGMKEYKEKLATYEYSLANKEAIIDKNTADYIAANADSVNALVEQNMPQGVDAAVKQQLEPQIQNQLEAYKAANPEATAEQLAAAETQIREAVYGGYYDTVKAQIEANPDAMAQVRALVTEQVHAGVRQQVAAQVDASLADAQKQLEAGKAKLDAAAKEIEAGEKKLSAAESEIAAGRQKLIDAAEQLTDAEQQLADGKEQLDTFEEGQAQVDAGYAVLMKNEKIAAKVNGEGMDALDAGYLVVEESTAETTEDLVTRAVYIGLSMLAALIGIVAAAMSAKGRRVNVIAGVMLLLMAAALILGVIRSFSAHPLQMAAMIVLMIAAIVFTVSGMKSKEAA